MDAENYVIQYPLDAVHVDKFADLLGKPKTAVSEMVKANKLPIIELRDPCKPKARAGEKWVFITDLSDWLEDYVLLSIELLNTGAYEIVNWKELSERGLVFRINHEIMHQLGLAVMYEPETGMSGGAMVATDGAWNYSDEQMERAQQNGWLG
ncbi:hypothetical protein B6Q94_17295 [Escherichia coli]|nr:hypothetical protein [Escherichia coli]EFO2521834.1 hypothetical protein [Escherichia coli]EFO2553357.1 hypothetical protein [Escherichia coli]EFO2696737.1 hypothetical protein [Escherichia coli]